MEELCFYHNVWCVIVKNRDLLKGKKLAGLEDIGNAITSPFATIDKAFPF